MELEPDYWEWNYYAGKVVGRLRRVAWSKDVFPEIQEMIFLEKAVSLYRQNASSLVHLANLYRVLAQIRYRYQTNLESQADQLHPSTLPQVRIIIIFYPVSDQQLKQIIQSSLAFQ